MKPLANDAGVIKVSVGWPVHKVPPLDKQKYAGFLIGGFMSYFTDKVCVITGAGNGIGRATAKRLAKDGAKLVLTDINSANLTQTQSMVETLGGTSETHIVDAASREQAFTLAEHVERKYGAADLILNNAGIANIAPIDDLTIEDFQFVMDVDFWGVVHGTQAFLPQMRSRDSGHIANVSSIFGWVGVPNQAAYNSAKFAVFGFTEAIRQELQSSGIKVTCIHPGGIDTSIARNARLVQGPDDEERREQIAQDFKKMVRSTPEQAANTILKGVSKGKARVLIGRDAYMVDFIRRIFPVSYGRFLGFGDVINDADGNN